MKVIGVTGGIASGKSLISDWFEKAQIKVIDADKVYRSLIKTHKKMLKEIITAFNLKQNANQPLDLKELGHIVFNSKKEMIKLNKITHPYVIEMMEEQIEDHRLNEESIIVLDVPLLFEAKMEKYCDSIICVYTDKETQIDRLRKRGHLTREAAIQRIDSQMSLEIKKEKSDYVIDNSYSKDHSYSQFTQILAKIKSY